jgi:hypothetical protein
MADLKEVSIALVSTTTVSLAATGQTTLFTVPAGKRFVPTKALVIAGADAGASIVTLGKSTALTDFLAAQTLSNLDAQYDAVKLQPIQNATPVKQKSYAAGDIFQIDVTTAAGGATNTVKLFGFLYDA